MPYPSELAAFILPHEKKEAERETSEHSYSTWPGTLQWTLSETHIAAAFTCPGRTDP